MRLWCSFRQGPVLDLASNPLNIKIAEEFWASGKVVSAVCHGTAALVGVKEEISPGEKRSILYGRRVTGFSNEEEKSIDGLKDLPFLLEDRVIAAGGKYEKAELAWGERVVADGRLITGQVRDYVT